MTAAAVILVAAVCTLVLLRVRYPVRYRTEIERCAAENALDPALVAAVIWTESGFDKDARSSRGACGLMQLTEPTAEYCASLMNKEFDPSRLFEPEYNIELGSFYLSYLIEKFDGDTVAALAAYNAGEGNVSAWLAEKRRLLPPNLPPRDIKTAMFAAPPSRSAADRFSVAFPAVIKSDSNVFAARPLPTFFSPTCASLSFPTVGFPACASLSFPAAAEPDVTLEISDIPFPETSAYVTRCLSALNIYSAYFN